MEDKIEYIGWVQIISDDSTLSQYSYELLKSKQFYRVGLVPDHNILQNPKLYLRVFLEDLSFYVVHERHFRELTLDESRDLLIDNILK